MRSIRTIADLISNGYSVTAHCEADPTVCRHASVLDLPMLGERLGMGFVAVGDPNPLAARLVCPACGGKRIGLILSPPNTPSPGSGYLSKAYA